MKAPIEILLDTVEWEPVADPAKDDDELYATHFGTLKVGDFELRVFQLSDGQRIILKEDLERFFGNGLLP
jgi:hypothetical protein